MLNALWFGMIVASVLYALVSGEIGNLSTALLDGSSSAVELTVSMLGSLCAWLGFLKIAEKSGLTERMAQVLAPLIGRLFPEYREDLEIQGKICMNLSANLLGLGNAATPLGLSAMRAMSEKNPSDVPSRGMILFVVLNTASIQLLPVNMATMRASCGSAEPFAILPHIWIASAGALLCCVTVCKLVEQREKRIANS